MSELINYALCEGKVTAKAAELKKKLDAKLSIFSYPTEELTEVKREVERLGNKALLGGVVAGGAIAIAGSQVDGTPSKLLLMFLGALVAAGSLVGYKKSQESETITEMVKKPIDFGALGLHIRKYLGDIDREISAEWKDFLSANEVELSEFIDQQDWDSRIKIERKQSLYIKPQIDFNMQAKFGELTKAFETKQIESYKRFVDSFGTEYSTALQVSTSEVLSLYKSIFSNN